MLPIHTKPSVEKTKLDPSKPKILIREIPMLAEPS